MNPSHYPSLELCKKLDISCFPMTEEFITEVVDGVRHSYVMPNVMEMLDVMPDSIMFRGEKCKMTIEKRNGFYHISYRSHIVSSRIEAYFTQDTLPIAISAMILWLHENNYISFSK